LILNSCPSTPIGKITVTGAAMGTAMLTTSSVTNTVTGVVIAVRTAIASEPTALTVIVFAPVPDVGVTVMPVPPKMEVGLFAYDMIIFLLIKC
jgi:hypothetical protein